jgi:hypothetical protein
MTDPTPAPDWRALCKELRDALENAFQVMAGEGGTQHISTATDVLLRADAHLATPPDRLRQCPTHGQQPENAWGCPECVRELREELAATEESSVAQSNPAPPEGLTDERLLELMPQQFRDDLAAASRLAAQDAGPDIKPGVFRVMLNTGALAYARAAIAAHDAARAPAQLPTTEEIEARFRAWWADSYPSAPAGPHAVASHAAFALYLLGQEGAA